MNRILLLFSVILLLSCENKQQETVWLDPNSISQGPIIHDSLTLSQIDNIDYLYNTFNEVDPTSKEEWLEDFKRDLNPDNEIEIWMMMANAYNSYCQKKEIDITTKKEVFQIVLMRSSVPEDEVLTHLNLMHVSEKEAKEIMQAYKLVAKPIKVVKGFQ